MDEVFLTLTLAVLVIVAVFGLYKLKIYFNGGVCTSRNRLDGKTVIVTGATSGIGRVCAKQLANRGATVILAIRNLEKAKPIVKDIIEHSRNNNVRAMKLDLTSLKSVVEFVQEFKSQENRLDILINNAGITSQSREVTEDGFECIFQSNYLGHFLLTMLLLDLLKKSAPARIINVSSIMHLFARQINFDDINGERSFNKAKAYCQSKLAQIMFTRKMARLLKDSGVSVFSLHPGAVRTPIYDNSPVFSIEFIYRLINFSVFYYFGKSNWQGAQTTLHCALERGLESHSGSYFSDCEVVKLRSHATNEEATERLWNMSLDMVKQYYTNPDN